MFNVPTHTLTDADDLAYTLVIGAEDADDLFDLIAAIDQQAENWEFTERLYQYFKPLHKEYKRIVKEDNL